MIFKTKEPWTFAFQRSVHFLFKKWVWGKTGKNLVLITRYFAGKNIIFLKIYPTITTSPVFYKREPLHHKTLGRAGSSTKRFMFTRQKSGQFCHYKLKNLVLFSSFCPELVKTCSKSPLASEPTLGKHSILFP